MLKTVCKSWFCFLYNCYISLCLFAPGLFASYRQSLTHLWTCQIFPVSLWMDRCMLEVPGLHIGHLLYRLVLEEMLFFYRQFPDTWEKLGVFKFGLTVLFNLPLKRETKAPQITAEDRLKRNGWWFNFYNLFFLGETCLGMLGLHENPLQFLKKNVRSEWGILFSITVCYKTSKTSFFFFFLLHCFLFVNFSSSFSLPV